MSTLRLEPVTCQKLTACITGWGEAPAHELWCTAQLENMKCQNTSQSLAFRHTLLDSGFSQVPMPDSLLQLLHVTIGRHRKLPTVLFLLLLLLLSLLWMWLLSLCLLLLVHNSSKLCQTSACWFPPLWQRQKNADTAAVGRHVTSSAVAVGILLFLFVTAAAVHLLAHLCMLLFTVWATFGRRRLNQGSGIGSQRCRASRAKWRSWRGCCSAKWGTTSSTAPHHGLSMMSRQQVWL